MQQFIRSTDPKQWLEIDLEPLSPRSEGHQGPKGPRGRWKLAKDMVVGRLKQRKALMHTMSSAIRVMFYWQQRIRKVADAVDHGRGHFHSTEHIYDVFLGGSCNPTVWRFEIAMPFCDQYGISYYNPQVEEWSDELVELEARAKQDSEFLFFVIDSQTRALASIVEATEYICTGREVILVIFELEEGVDIAGHKLEKREVNDLNRGRRYLQDVASRHGVVVHNNVIAGLGDLKSRLGVSGHLLTPLPSPMPTSTMPAT